LAAEIRSAFPSAVITLTPSSGGRFEVMRDGSPIFEKSKLRRHAEAGEVVKLLSIRDTSV